MRIRLIKKEIITFCIIAFLILTLGISESNAALQANQNTQYTTMDGLGNWMTNIRKMETTGGGLGLNETINEDLTTSSESNDIDVHLVKTTEYGAVAILSASGYGNPSNELEITTTTGNNTGMILNTGYWEFTAGGIYGPFEINDRYFDIYTGDRESVKAGDALGISTTSNPGAAGWHGATNVSWGFGMWNDWPWFARGNGGIFNYTTMHPTSSGSHAARSVAVCGKGL